MTKPTSEEVAERSVRQAGYRTYLPRYRKLLRGVRIENGRRIRTRGDGDLVMRPLFSCYVFAELHPGDGGGAIGRSTGVVRVMRHRAEADGNARPRMLADEVVEAIRERERRGDFDEARPGAKAPSRDRRYGRGDPDLVPPRTRLLWKTRTAPAFS